jgi:hypothetical protein
VLATLNSGLAAIQLKTLAEHDPVAPLIANRPIDAPH